MNLAPKKIAILTSGGDAPGMNAAIRSCVIHALNYGYEVLGYKHGYNGLINNEVISLTFNDVNNIIHLGGTILKSARCPAMHTENGIKQAVNNLVKEGIDALIVIGGDGSFQGLLAIQALWSGKLIGLPGTIDNDIYGTESTIGFATAVNTALEAIDKIRDTADAFERIFIVELMGKHSGHITYNVGLAGGCEKVLSFENFYLADPDSQLHQIALDIRFHQENFQSSYILCIAENLWPDGSQALAKTLMDKFDIDATVCILGHIQRGGSPVAEDRIMATQMGIDAIEAITSNISGVMIGINDQQLTRVPLTKTLATKKVIDLNIINAQNTLNRAFEPK